MEIVYHELVWSFFFLPVVLGIKHRAWYILGKHSTTVFHPQHSFKGVLINIVFMQILTASFPTKTIQ
jgi:hypothetical protein